MLLWRTEHLTCTLLFILYSIPIFLINPAKSFESAYFICLLLHWRLFIAKCSLKCSSLLARAAKSNEQFIEHFEVNVEHC